MSDQPITPRQLARTLLGIVESAPAPEPKPESAKPIRSVPSDEMQAAVDLAVERALAKREEKEQP